MLEDQEPALHHRSSPGCALETWESPETGLGYEGCGETAGPVGSHSDWAAAAAAQCAVGECSDQPLEVHSTAESHAWTQPEVEIGPGAA